MDIDSIIKALTKDALYTYEFDVTTGIVEKDHTGETTYDVTYRRRNDSDHCHDRQCLCGRYPGIQGSRNERAHIPTPGHHQSSVSYLQIYKEITPKFQTAVQPEPISH